MAQDAEIPPSIYTAGSNLSVVDNFKYFMLSVKYAECNYISPWSGLLFKCKIC